MGYENLFKPIEIGGVVIKNRIVMAAMAMNDGSPPGHPSEQSKAMCAARAKGGVGLIILGGTFSTKKGYDTQSYRGAFRMDTDETLVPITELVERIHSFNASVFVQLMPCLGRHGTSRFIGEQLVSCVAEPYRILGENMPKGMTFPGEHVGEIPRELTIQEIINMEDESANSALRAIAVGFDGMEIPCHHGYLPFSFLSPRINKRTDSYGGSVENRLRFVLNIIKKTRDKIGPDFPIGIRLSAAEHMEGGLTCDECVAAAKILEKEGIDFIDLSDGVHETAKYIFPDEDGLMLKHGEPQAFKKALKIPVITPSIHEPDKAEEAIASRKTDMIQLGRQLLADPEWANKVKDGKINQIRKCDRDSACVIRLHLGLPVRCPVNPNLGRERFMPEYYQPPFQAI
jgi:2,4-dienoyl-CoA reductase (NADPH2)